MDEKSPGFFLRPKIVELRPDPVPRSLGTIPRDRGFRDGFPRDKRDNLSNLIILYLH